MPNPFDTRSTSLSGPGVDYEPVVPSDTTDLGDTAVSLFVETGGVVAFVSQKGFDRVVQLPDYGFLACGVRRVKATGTTAAGIHAVVVT
ncbi:MAG: hypothetical protein AAF367_04915 [Pseudomonadota bacterium]